MRLRGDYSGELDGIYTFWAAVDSASFYHPARCDCKRDGADQHCEECMTDGPSWEVARGAGCLATMSTRLRCHREVMLGIPFCAFHLERVEGWLMDRLDRHVQKLARRELAMSKQVYLRETLDHAIVADAERIVEKSKSRVYFLGIDGEIVKIGYSINPISRAASIRAGSSICPEGYDRKQADLIGSIPGGQIVEARLHSALAPHRIDGEWFHLHADVQAVIGFLLTGEGERAANKVFLDAVVRPWWASEGFASEADAMADDEVVAS